MRRVLACRLRQAGVDIKSLSSIRWSSAVEQTIQMDGKVTLGACSRQDNKVAFWRRLSSASGDAEETREITNPKVLELADRIVELNMLEVSDLTELLRKRLNVQTPSVPMGFAMPTSSPAGAVSAPGGASADSSPAEEKTDFSIKLTGFDAASKIKVIKEVRAITDLGLKEAKELVEKSPTVIKEGMSKEDAEELKAKLEAAGAQISLE